jgi:hypothetical protein
MKGEFASFVKSHYDKVRDLPARERLKALGEMFRNGRPQAQPGGAMMHSSSERASPVMFEQMTPAKRIARRRRTIAVQEPLSLVPPSVPVDRASTPGTNVPGALYSGVQTSNPHEQAIAIQRRTQPKERQAQGTFIKQGGSQLSPTGTDLKTIMAMFGMGMPKHMRNVMHGGRLSKNHMKKIYEQTMATHGKDGMKKFQDMFSGLTQAFRCAM